MLGIKAELMFCGIKIELVFCGIKIGFMFCMLSREFTEVSARKIPV